MAIGLEEFLWVILPSASVAVFMYIFFSWARRKYPSFYEYRVWNDLPGFEAPPQSLSREFCGWVLPLLRLPLAEIARTSGLDAAAYVAFQALAFSILGLSSLFIFLTLVPIYATGVNGLSGLDWVSLSNVAQKSWRLWPCAFMLWIGSALWYTALYKGVSLVASIKLQRERCIHSTQDYTVLVRPVPARFRATEAVRQYFEKLWPGQVLHVSVVRDLSAYDGLVDAYTKAWRGLKRSEVIIAEKCQSQTATWPACFPLCGWKEAVPYYSEQVRTLRAQIEEERENYQNFPATRAAFVTFRSLATAAEAKATRRGGQWHCRYAPEPREILWRNLGRPPAVLFGMSAHFAVAVFVVVIFFGVPVAMTQSFVNLETLQHKYRWLAWSVHSIPHELRTLLQSLLPTLVLVALQALVLPLIQLLAQGSGVEEARAVQKRVMIAYFFFLMFNFFFVIVCSGAVFDTLHLFSTHPDRIFEFLGVSMPKVGSFFMLFITLRALSTAPGHIALITNFALREARLRLVCRTDFECEEASDPGFPPYGSMYADDLFVFCVSMSYAVISPWILLFGTLYFALNLITGKYLLCFVFRNEYQASGAHMVVAVQLALTGLMIGQMTCVAVIFLKESTAWLVCLPLPILTLAFIIWLPHGVGKPLARQDIPRDLAAELDTDGTDVSGLLRAIEEDHLFVQPSLSLDLDNPLQKPADVKAARGIVMEDISLQTGDVAHMSLAMNASIPGVDATVIGAIDNAVGTASNGAH